MVCSQLLVRHASCHTLVDKGCCGALQHSSGVSRDEVAAALIEVAEGRVPKDRVALRELHREMVEWPYLDAEVELDEGTESNYEGITETGKVLARAAINAWLTATLSATLLKLTLDMVALMRQLKDGHGCRHKGPAQAQADEARPQREAAVHP